MQYTKDTKLRGHAFSFDSPMDVIDSAERGYKISKRGNYLGSSTNWTDKNFESWNHLREVFLKPWKEGIETVEDMLNEIKAQELPRPKSRRRKARWSEDDGEIDIDRVMVGDADFYREVKREIVHGPSNVLLLTNLDAYGNDTHSKIFWRGAAAIAAADLIEDAGYSVEIWVWCHGTRVYSGSCSQQFHAFPLKRAGEPIDIGTMINALSGWFLRTVLYNTFADTTTKTIGTGGPNFELGGWRKYIDAGTDDMIEIQMPVAESKKEATECAKEMLADLLSQQQQ